MANFTGVAGSEVLTGTDQSDYFFNPSSGNDTILGGGGYDALSYATAGGYVVVSMVTFPGAIGQNTVWKPGPGGTDTFTAIERIIGTSGNDTFRFANSSSSTAVYFVGGPGADTIDANGIINVYAEYTESSAPVSANLAAGWAIQNGETDTLVNVRAIRTSSGNDTLVGSAYSDFIHPGAGTNTVDGGTGFDTLVVANTGSAPISITMTGAGSGIATIAGTTSTTFTNIEQVVGALGNDTFIGSDGDDRFAPAGGNNTADGGAGFNTISYGLLTEGGTLTGVGITANLATGTATNLYGGTDRFTNFQGVIGSYLADDLTGVDTGSSTSRSLLHGLEGNDTLRGAATGWTAADYSDNPALAAVTVNLTAGYASDGRQGTDTLIGINSVRGSQGNDIIIGDSRANWLSGDAGDDQMFGGGGDDRLEGGAGVDTATYGAGMAQYDVMRRGGVVWVADRAERSTDTLTGIENLSFRDGTIASANLLSTSALEYVASYDDLIAAFGTDATAANAHLFSYGLYEGRTGHFDALRYIASNNDLMGAFGANEDAGAAHWIQFGRFEGRNTTGFDSVSYLASNNDLLAAFGKDLEASTTHYIQFGRFEGRSGHFDGLAYIASYADLSQVLGVNQAAGTLHFVQFGHDEGRSVTFDGLQYLASYGDLIQAFGANTTAAAEHYILSGRNEGRAMDHFDAAHYLANYADLQAAFGSDETAATLHFITSGYYEGRTDGLL